MDIQKEREAFERHKAKQLKIDYVSLKNVLDDCERRFPNNRYAGYSDFNRDFETWLAAKAQALPDTYTPIVQALEDVQSKIAQASFLTMDADNENEVYAVDANELHEYIAELIEAQEPAND